MKPRDEGKQQIRGELLGRKDSVYRKPRRNAGNNGRAGKTKVLSLSCRPNVRRFSFKKVHLTCKSVKDNRKKEKADRPSADTPPSDQALPRRSAAEPGAPQLPCHWLLMMSSLPEG